MLYFNNKMIKIFSSILISFLFISTSYAYPGCTDPNACNYDPYATIDDGSCSYDYDQDQICDDIDFCFGYDNNADMDNDGICNDIDPCYGQTQWYFDEDGNIGFDYDDDDNDGICNDFEDICGACENVWEDNSGYWPGDQCCDAAWYQWGFDCAYMEEQFNWDCMGCNCIYDENSICGDGYCTGDENIDVCPSDCTNNGCNINNQVDDCFNDDCCPIEWIGDGYCDDGQWCNLQCYENDGGDCPPSSGDINEDGTVDVLDVIIAVDGILNGQYNVTIDLSNDNIINIVDIILLINIILDN